MVERSFIRLVSFSVVMVAVAAGHARAQEQLSLGPGEDMNGAAPAQTHPRGTYAGVKAGGDQKPEINVDAKPGTTPAQITWPGFQMQPDGSSRVFVQSTAPLNSQAAMTSSTQLVVDLGDAKVAGPNNRRPLDTSFFNTPVTRVTFKSAQKRIILELTLRAPVQPRITSDQAKSGFYFVYIDFPPGKYVQAPMAAEAPPPPPVTDGASLDDAPSALDDRATDANASARASTAMDGELPPGMSKPKAGGKAKARAKTGLKLGTQ
jgi:hypothetical protein